VGKDCGAGRRNGVVGTPLSLEEAILEMEAMLGKKQPGKAGRRFMAASDKRTGKAESETRACPETASMKQHFADHGTKTIN